MAAGPDIIAWPAIAADCQVKLFDRAMGFAISFTDQRPAAGCGSAAVVFRWSGDAGNAGSATDGGF